MEKTNYSNSNGIYIILNIVDWKAYVGQAAVFNNRDHKNELENGIDNDKLQMDYNNDVEFVYYVACYNPDKFEEINIYERLYMTLMEDFHFELYNEQCNNSENARNNRTIDKLNITQSTYNEATSIFVTDFTIRFGIEPQKLFESSIERRKEAINYYANQRLTDFGKKKFKGDIFLFSSQRLKKYFRDKTICINSLDISEMFISKAGCYLGEGIDQIVNYEMEAIDKHDYCLWTFSNQAVSYNTVKKCCEARQKQHKDTYVLFEYTISSIYANVESQRFNCLSKKYASELSDDVKEFLSFEPGKYGHYYVPEDIDCTAAGTTGAKAFVIQELLLLDGIYNSQKLNEYYKAVGSKGLYEIEKGGYQRSTFYIRNMDTNMKVSDVIEKPVRRKFCFVGKMASPYVIQLKSKEK